MLVLGDLGRNNASCRAARASLLSSGSSRARSGTFSARREAAAHLRLKLNSQCRSVSPTLALTELRIESSQRWEPNIHAIAKIAPSGASAPGTLLDATSSFSSPSPCRRLDSAQTPMHMESDGLCPKDQP